MFDIIAPESAPQSYVPPLRGVGHPLAMEVLTALRHQGHTPIPLWKLINRLASARQPQGRDQRRCLCLRFWGAARELLKAGLLFRHDGLVALQDFALNPKARSRVRLSSSVGRSTSKTTVSGPTDASTEVAANVQQKAERELFSGTEDMPTRRAEAQSATPTPDEISAAARALPATMDGLPEG